MIIPSTLRTDRLRLRWWLSADKEPFAMMNSDPRVTEYLPGTLSREESDALVTRIDAHFCRHGFGLWAVEICDQTPLAGFVGLSVPQFEEHSTPGIHCGVTSSIGSHAGQLPSTPLQDTGLRLAAET